LDSNFNPLISIISQFLSYQTFIFLYHSLLYFELIVDCMSFTYIFPGVQVYLPIEARTLPYGTLDCTDRSAFVVCGRYADQNVSMRRAKFAGSRAAALQAVASLPTVSSVGD
jgi:hypothetical protein